MSLTKLWVFGWPIINRFQLPTQIWHNFGSSGNANIDTPCPYRISQFGAAHNTIFVSFSLYRLIADVSASVVSIWRVRVKGHNSQNILDRFQVWQLLPSIFRLCVKIIAKIQYRWNSFIYLKGWSVLTKESEISFQLNFKYHYEPTLLRNAEKPSFACQGGCYLWHRAHLTSHQQTLSLKDQHAHYKSDTLEYEFEKFIKSISISSFFKKKDLLT